MSRGRASFQDLILLAYEPRSKLFVRAFTGASTLVFVTCFCLRYGGLRACTVKLLWGFIGITEAFWGFAGGRPKPWLPVNPIASRGP